MLLDPKAKEWSFFSRSSCLKLSQISLQMAESHVEVEFLEIVFQIKVTGGTHPGKLFYNAGNATGELIIFVLNQPKVNFGFVMVYFFQFCHQFMGALVIVQQGFKCLIFLPEHCPWCKYLVGPVVK